MSASEASEEQPVVEEGEIPSDQKGLERLLGLVGIASVACGGFVYALAALPDDTASCLKSMPHFRDLKDITDMAQLGRLQSQTVAVTGMAQPKTTCFEESLYKRPYQRRNSTEKKKLAIVVLEKVFRHFKRYVKSSACNKQPVTYQGRGVELDRVSIQSKPIELHLACNGKLDMDNSSGTAFKFDEVLEHLGTVRYNHVAAHRVTSAGKHTTHYELQKYILPPGQELTVFGKIVEKPGESGPAYAIEPAGHGLLGWFKNKLSCNIPDVCKESIPSRVRREEKSASNFRTAGKFIIVVGIVCFVVYVGWKCYKWWRNRKQ